MAEAEKGKIVKAKNAKPSTALVVASAAMPGLTKDDVQFLEAALASKAFGNIKDIAQAAVKLQVGREVGLSPALALSQVYIVGGVPSFSAGFIAARVKASRPRYDYRPLKHDKDSCKLQFLQDGEPWGEYEFTMKDAEQAVLTRNESWKKYPKPLLFARALTAGVRVYCPDVLHGVIAYTPEELGSVPAPEDIQEAEFTEK